MTLVIRNCSRHVHAHFLPKQSCCFLRQVRNVHTTGRGILNTLQSKVYAFSFRRCLGTTPQLPSSIICSPRRLETKYVEALLQCSRPMSKLSKQDEDVKRMRQALHQPGPLHSTSGTGDHILYEVRAIGMMRFCTLFFYFTSLTGLYMAPDIIFTSLEHTGFNGEMLLDFVAIFIGVVALPVLLTQFNKRLVLKLYYSHQRKSYVAMTQSVFLTLKRFEFSHKDVVPSNRSSSFLGMFNLTSLKARGRPYFINPYNFKIPSDYNKLMGF